MRILFHQREYLTRMVVCSYVNHFQDINWYAVFVNVPTPILVFHPSICSVLIFTNAFIVLGF
jgi:hypothetical protein